MVEMVTLSRSTNMNKPAQNKKSPERRNDEQGFLKKFRRRPTLPHRPRCSTIGDKKLNFRVR
ncbi:MAG: hypothetical protein MI747_13935, partial [Desulfobacterales bacterium]|nr:hypothetical protein [Desulfobacterales bacterium]